MRINIEFKSWFCHCAPQMARRDSHVAPPVQEKIAFSSFIGPHYEGQALVEFLTRRFTYFDQAKWQEIIGSGDVLLNGDGATGAERLNNGDEVRYLAMTRPEPKVPTLIPVLYEDEDLLIVNKPPHIPVHPGGRYLRNTLINVLKAQRRDELLFLAHRLDRETSGVCVLTKTHMAKEKMYWQFFNYETEKTYWALVWGIPTPASGIVDAAMGPADPKKSRIRIKQVVGGPEAKSAKTHYHTLSTQWIEAPQWQPPAWPALVAAKTRRGSPRSLDDSDTELASPWPVSLVECKPRTGRTNQIRVHLAHIGAGLLGDKLYDPDESIFLRFKDAPPLMTEDRSRNMVQLAPELMSRLVLDAHALHAKGLKFRHPRTQKTIEITAPAPTSWTGLFKNPELRAPAGKPPRRR